MLCSIFMLHLAVSSCPVQPLHPISSSAAQHCSAGKMGWHLRLQKQPSKQPSRNQVIISTVSLAESELSLFRLACVKEVGGDEVDAQAADLLATLQQTRVLLHNRHLLCSAVHCHHLVQEDNNLSKVTSAVSECCCSKRNASAPTIRFDQDYKHIIMKSCTRRRALAPHLASGRREGLVRIAGHRKICRVLKDFLAGFRKASWTRSSPGGRPLQGLRGARRLPQKTRPPWRPAPPAARFQTRRPGRAPRRLPPFFVRRRARSRPHTPAWITHALVLHPLQAT